MSGLTLALGHLVLFFLLSSCCIFLGFLGGELLLFLFSQALGRILG